MLSSPRFQAFKKHWYDRPLKMYTVNLHTSSLLKTLEKRCTKIEYIHIYPPIFRHQHLVTIYRNFPTCGPRCWNRLQPSCDPTEDKQVQKIDGTSCQYSYCKVYWLCTVNAHQWVKCCALHSQALCASGNLGKMF